MAEGFSIIKIDDISKPANTLIEKISDAIGGLFKPYQIKRVAKAEAEVDIIEAEAQIKIDKLQRRALSRFIAEEAKKQNNIESITEKAIPLLEDSSNPQDMEDDWITNFFDKCRIISDEDMQLLWSRILAGEANYPGTYSKRTVNLLGSLDKTDAQSFTTLCCFTWVLEKPIPLIYDWHDPIYKEQGINYDSLSHLDDIGLIHYETFGALVEAELPQRICCYYHKIPLNVEFMNPEQTSIGIGSVIFTKTGEQIYRVCEPKQVDGFYDYVIRKWVEQKLIISSPLDKKE
jgi:hypothetical protein